MSVDEFQATRIGDEPNVAREEMRRRRQRRKEREQLRTSDLAQVIGYDFESQRVTVALLFRPEETYRNVPVLGTGAPKAEYRPFDVGTEEGDSGVFEGGTIGALVWPRIDGTGGFQDRRTKSPMLTDRHHEGHAPYFIPYEALLVSDEPANAANVDATASDQNQIGPNDYADVWYPGTEDEVSLIVKEDGVVSLNVPSDAEVIITRDGQEGTEKAVVRDGDSVSDTDSDGVADIVNSSQSFTKVSD